MKVQIAAAAALLAVVAPPVVAQTAAAHIAMGDQARSSMNASSALEHYEAAVAADSNDYTALWKAAGEAIDLGEFASKEQRTPLFQKAERLARRAVAANPNGADGHYTLARALGRTALTLGTRDRIRYATEVRAEALEALRLDPNHAGAMHVLGVWNAEVMRLSGIERFMAKKVLGGKVFGEASWDNAQRYMEQAVAADPTGLTHHLDLARVYRDRDDKAQARASYQRVIDGAARDFNDPHYKEAARRELARLD